VLTIKTAKKKKKLTKPLEVGNDHTYYKKGGATLMTHRGTSRLTLATRNLNRSSKRYSKA
jgi:hypothetical protein